MFGLIHVHMETIDHFHTKRGTFSGDRAVMAFTVSFLASKLPLRYIVQILFFFLYLWIIYFEGAITYFIV